MKSRPRPKTLSQLKKIWYDRLKEEGFQDIEYPNGYLTVGRPQSEDYKDPILRQAYEEYFRMAGRFLHEYDFDSRLEKTIWEYHANGMGIRDITKTLRKVKIKIGQTKVFGIVTRLSKTMKEMYISYD